MTSLVPSVGVRAAAIFARKILLTFMMRIHVDVKQPFVTELFFANEAAAFGFRPEREKKEKKSEMRIR